VLTRAYPTTDTAGSVAQVDVVTAAGAPTIGPTSETGIPVSGTPAIMLSFSEVDCTGYQKTTALQPISLRTPLLECRLLETADRWTFPE